MADEEVLIEVVLDADQALSGLTQIPTAVGEMRARVEAELARLGQGAAPFERLVQDAQRTVVSLRSIGETVDATRGKLETLRSFQAALPTGVGVGQGTQEYVAGLERQLAALERFQARRLELERSFQAGPTVAQGLQRGASPEALAGFFNLPVGSVQDFASQNQQFAAQALAESRTQEQRIAAQQAELDRIREAARARQSGPGGTGGGGLGDPLGPFTRDGQIDLFGARAGAASLQFAAASDRRDALSASDPKEAKALAASAREADTEATAILRGLNEIKQRDIASTAELAEVERRLALARETAGVGSARQQLARLTESSAALRAGSLFGPNGAEDTEQLRANTTLAAQIRAREALTKANEAAGGEKGFLSTAIGDFGGIAKYVLAYQVLSDIQRVLKDSVTETLNFERGVTNLALVLGTSRDNARDLGNQLGDAVSRAGLGPSQGAAFATQFIGPFQGQADARTLGLAGANLGGTLAILSGGKDAVNDLSQATAATRGLGGGFADVNRIVDAAVSASQRFLGSSDPARVLPGLAQVSDLFQQAGFRPEQAANIVAQVTARTGESSTAVGGELQRFLGREGASAFQRVFARAGVDTSQNFSSELSQLAPIFERASPQERASIVSTIGGGRAGPAATALLETLAQGNADALKLLTQGGSADRAASNLQNDLKGTLDQLLGTFKNLEKAIGESGLLIPIGALVKSLVPVTSALDQLLSAISPVSKVLFPVAEVLGAIAVGGKLLSKASGATDVEISKAEGEAKVQETVATRAATEATSIFARALLVSSGLIEKAGVASLAEKAVGSSFIGGRTGLIESGVIATIGASVALDVLKLNNAQINAGNAGEALFGSRSTSLDTSEALAKSFSKAATDINIANQGFLGRIIQGADFLLGSDTGSTARQDQRLSQRFADSAKFEEDIRARAARTGVDATLSLNLQNQTGVADGLKRLSDSGVDARTQVDILVKSLDNLTLAGSKAGRVLSPTEGSIEANRFAANASSGFVDFGKTLRDAGAGTFLDNPILQSIPIAGAAASALGFLFGAPKRDTSQQDRGKALTDLGNDKGFLDAASGDVQTFLSANALTTESRKQLIQLLESRVALTSEFKRADKAGRDAINGEIVTLVNQLQGDISNQVRPEITTANALEALKQAPTLAANAGKISATDIQLRDSAIAGTDTASIVDTKAQINEIQRIIDAAKRTGKVDPNDLKVDQAKIRELTVQLNSQIAQQIQELGAVATASLSPFQTGERLVSQISAVQAALDSIPKGDVASRRPLEVKLLDLNNQRAADAQATLDSIRASQERPGSPTSQLLGQLEITRANLIDIQNRGGAGSKAEADAIKAYRDARYQYGIALGEDAKNLQLLRGDQTDPVAVAAATLAQARATLARDRANGTGNLNADQLAVNSAQQAATSAKLTQQLGDERNLFDLRQISGATYLQFLEQNDTTLRRQLAATKQGTEGYRRIKDELVNVDKEILGLNNQLQGQFNLGTISVPTVFEARRSLANPTAGGGGQVVNNITISGADTAKVTAVITSILGRNAIQTRSPSTAGRKL